MFRQLEYQQAESPSVYFRTLNEETLFILQIENLQAVENVEEIITVPGVDVAMIGAQDLSLDMGLAGQANHPQMVEAAQRVSDACCKHGVVSGNHLQAIGPLVDWMKRGMRMIVYSYETNLMLERGKEVLKALKDNIDPC